MVPLKLRLRNFLCYGEDLPPLDLEGVHLACLCGQNGHGKSALLDAMTWALWGKARAKSQDELVRFGQTEMMVELDFMAGENTYRASRRHVNPGRQGRSGATELQLLVQSNGSFQPITGNAVRETQSKIDQIVGMDYDTFINSAFLLQGRADEFTNKRPGERKEVLAKIIGLERYDRLEDMAKQRSQEKRGESQEMQRQLEQLRLEVSKAGAVELELESVERELARVVESLEAKRESRDALRMQVQSLAAQRAEAETLTARVPALKDELARHKSENERLGARIAGYVAVTAQRPEIERGHLALTEARARRLEMDALRDQHDKLTEARRTLAAQIETAKVRLEEKIAQLERRTKGRTGTQGRTGQRVGRTVGTHQDRTGRSAWGRGNPGQAARLALQADDSNRPDGSSREAAQVGRAGTALQAESSRGAAWRRILPSVRDDVG